MARDGQEIGVLAPAAQASAHLAVQGRAVSVGRGAAANLDLVHRLGCGERQATERFVREHTGWMLGLAQRYLKDRTLAEDCVQEAFLQAFRSVRTFKGQSAIKSWLFRIVVNAALMRLRRRRCSEQPLDDLLAQIERGECRLEAHCCEVATPQDILQRKEVCELVATQLRRLPDTYRIVLLLRDIEGLSTEEAARLLGVTEGTVKVRLHRARAAFKVLAAPLLRLYV
jgi:RNA polymerase sigma-70 factor, ECF subfamily